MNLRQTIFTSLNRGAAYPTPTNISYFWNFGSLAGFCLAIQLVTGVVLAMHYTPHVDLAFSSVEHIMRDVNYGWLLRYTHANGASMFLLVLYCHIFRGLYYGSYMKPTELVWQLGVVILLLVMGAAFLGYVLPWGQMSFWGATVITNFISAVPLVGGAVVEWLWGGFSVNNATLNRFFSLHYILPFVVAVVALMHVVALHDPKSNNPLGVKGHDTLPLHPYFTYKDIAGVVVVLVIMTTLVFFYPNVLGDPANYVEANPLVTPAQIVPEWYFLPFYTILRSVPNKLLGIMGMAGGILILAILPVTNTSKIRSTSFRPLYKQFFWLLVADVILLGWLGGQHAESPYTEIGQIASVYYFLYFTVLIQIVNKLEYYFIYFAGYYLSLIHI